ncbi:MAG: hypothetical protein ABSG80_08480 [Verrucomicrobiota bacterium]|jgi:hypothetical protein
MNAKINRMKSYTIPLFTLLLSAMLVAGVRAQSYSIDWAAISGGGGSSTGSVFSASGTIAQPAASGAMNGGSYSLTGGFWALYAVQAAGAPLLSISITNSAVMVTWSSTTANWILQQTTNLNAVNWEVSSATINTNGTVSFIIVTPPPGNRFRFYRLFHSQ